MIFQSFNLLPSLTVAENIVLSMDASGKAFGMPKKERAVQLLKEVHLPAEYANERILHLSGGEQQRVAIARALSYDPSVIVADEPTKGLDEIGSAYVARALFGYDKQVVFATHDVEMLTRPVYAIDRVLVLDEHRIVFDGAPAEAAAYYNDLIRRQYEALGR